MIKKPPTKAILQNKEYALRNEGNWYEAYRIVCLMNDENLSQNQKWIGSIIILFPDYEAVFESAERYREACEFIKYFIDRGKEEKNSDSGTEIYISLLQDIEMIVESLNVAKDRDVRLSYMHWWTFLGDLYNHEPSGTFKTVLEIRYKLKHNKKLEAWERAFYQNNRSLVDLEKTLNSNEAKFLDNILGVNADS